jgi:hypothetical protein
MSPIYIALLLLCGDQKRQNPSRMNYWETTLPILAALSASFVLADDFKTIDGKEYPVVLESYLDGDIIEGLKRTPDEALESEAVDLRASEVAILKFLQAKLAKKAT